MPYDRGDVLAAVHREGEVLVEAADDDGMRLRARLDDAAVASAGSRESSWCAEPVSRPARGLRPAARIPTTGSTTLRPMAAERHEGGWSTCRSARPCDPPPARRGRRARPARAPSAGYPPSIGIAGLPRGGGGLDGPPLRRRRSTRGQVAACVGTKELVAGLPAVAAPAHARPRHRALPGLSYPTYAMGADARRLPGRAGARRRRSGASTSPPSTEADAARALCLWVNTPGQPGRRARRPRRRRRAGAGPTACPCFSDECYVEFTWDGPAPARSSSTAPTACVAVHSLSKRSNLAGVRAGFYAGDADLVHYLSEVRKHAGFMVPYALSAVFTDAESEKFAQIGIDHHYVLAFGENPLRVLALHA